MSCNARMAHAKLSGPDVTVTNKSDKDVQLPKIAALDELVIAAMVRYARDETSGANAVQHAEVAVCAVEGLVELLERCVRACVSM